ncbi:MAG: peptidoglycan-binding domain-containing protein [Marinagarivorans sp.]
MGRLIAQGCVGEDVKAVQDVLNFHIRRLAPLTVDGKFGPRTKERVIEFQKNNQLKPDGLVGKNTLGTLFAEEHLLVTLALVPQAPKTKPTQGKTLPQGKAPLQGITPPRLIPPLTLPPITPPLTPPVLTPFFLPPNSFSRVPQLPANGQTMTFTLATPLRSDPPDPAQASFQQIMQLLNQLPANFPFRATLIGAVPQPVKKIGPLALDPVKPMTFGFQWGVKPVFDLKTFGPPPAFAVGASVNARYVLKVIDKPGSLIPQLGIFAQGDFKGTIDWTSQAAQSTPLIDMKGSFMGGVVGRF